MMVLEFIHYVLVVEILGIPIQETTRTTGLALPQIRDNGCIDERILRRKVMRLLIVN